MAIERENNGKRAMLQGKREHEARHFEEAARHFEEAARHFEAADKKQIAYFNQGVSLIDAQMPDEAIVALEAARAADLNSEELRQNLTTAHHNSNLKLYNEAIVANNQDTYQQVIARENIDSKLKLNSYCKLVALKLDANDKIDATLIEAKDFYNRLEAKAEYQNEAKFIFTHLAAFYFSENDHAAIVALLANAEDIKVEIETQLKDLALHKNTEGQTAEAMHMMLMLYHIFEGEAKAQVKGYLSEIALSQHADSFDAFAGAVLAGDVEHGAIDALFHVA